MVPFTRQTLFFSATMPPEIQRITEAFLHNPVRIEIARQATTAETITQLLVASPSHAAEKRETLRRLMRDSADAKNGIIFCNRKSDVQIVWKSLEKHGFSVAALHGDMDQRARTVALDGFRAGTTQYLVASDVAARGLDIPDVSHVFNYDAPHHAEDYVHRIGRTGRAGRLGTAYTIITSADDKNLSAIEAMIKRPIPWLGPSLADAKFEDAPRESTARGRREDAGRGRGGRKPRPVEATAVEATPDESALPSTEKRPSRTPRPPREAAPERQERMPQQPEAHRIERPAQAERPTREERPQRRTYHDDDGPTPKGLGDHMPGFLMRSTKVK
jgi:superfamily II DNA/RNA helicase